MRQLRSASQDSLIKAVGSKAGCLSPGTNWFLCAALFALVILLGLVLSQLSKNKRAGLLVQSRTLAVLSIFIGVIGGLVFALLSQHDYVTDAIGGIVLSIFVVQLGEVLRHSTLSSKLASLERALGSAETYKQVHTILDRLDGIARVAEKHPKMHVFLNEATTNTFTYLQDHLSWLAHGRIVIDSEARELTTNREFMLTLPFHQVRAISYQDEAFWDEPEGKDFLTAHETAIKNGLKITRIFICKKDQIHDPKQRTIIMNQVEIGVHCRVLIEEKLSENYRQDFTLYDQDYVRYAKPVSITTASSLKHATLTSEADVVRYYKGMFEFLAARSLDAVKVYSETAGFDVERVLA